jgi:hypothetical protein
MVDRRNFLTSISVATICGVLSSSPAFAAAKRLLFVHGRSQQGRDPEEIKSEWLGALKKGAEANGTTVPVGIEIALPFFGDTLDEFARQLEVPLTSDIHEKGGESVDEFLLFQAQLADEVRKRAGVTDAQIDAEYGQNPKEKGPLNWEWVQAIISAIDKHGGGISQNALEIFTRDVFLYTTRSGVRDEIDRIVTAALTEEPTIVVAHSLGSVVAYNILRTDTRSLKIPLFVTVGCPLGIRAISKNLRPLRYPRSADAWYNAFDDRDVVALFPLDQQNFPVVPEIENYAEVKNSTENRHGIIGYLDNKSVAKKILGGLGG